MSRYVMPASNSSSPRPSPEGWVLRAFHRSPDPMGHFCWLVDQCMVVGPVFGHLRPLYVGEYAVLL